MSAPPLPLLYLPLAWVGVIGTYVTYAALARAHIDVTRVFTSLNIRNQFTFAVCLYNIWTLAAAFVLYFLLQRHGITRAAVGLEGNLSLLGATLAVGGAVLGIAFWPILERITEFFAARLFRVPAPESRNANGSGVLELVLLTTCGVIIGPAVEEFIFRGYVLTALRQHTMSAPFAIIITSVVFASVHVALGLGLVLYAFFLSLMLSGLFLLSNNLYPAILMHSLMNFWGFVVAPILIRNRGIRVEQKSKDGDDDTRSYL
jgi:membrane protease YdiL (CAAX protease family)